MSQSFSSTTCRLPTPTVAMVGPGPSCQPNPVAAPGSEDVARGGVAAPPSSPPGTTAMKDYNRNSQMQSDANQRGNQLITQCAREIAKNFSGEFHIADFGCSHGKNSMACINAALDGVPTSCSTEGEGGEQQQRSFVVYLNDLPTNDFSEVFRCLSDPTISFTGHPALTEIAGTTVSTCINGKSFYEQCLPRDHLHLALSFNSLHWLTGSVADEKEGEVAVAKGLIPGAKFTTPAERESLHNLAHAQLVQFLTHRATELRRGGYLVLTVVESFGIADFLDQAWVNFLTANSLEPHQFAATCVPIYARSVAEVERALACVSQLLRVEVHEGYAIPTSNLPTAVIRSAMFNAIRQGVLASQAFSAANPDCSHHDPEGPGSRADGFVNAFFRSIDLSTQQSTAKSRILVLRRI